MSLFFISIIFIVFLCIFAYQGFKRFTLNNLVRALEKKDFDLVETLANMSSSRKVLGNYVCDLYKIRGYDFSKNVEKFEKQLQIMTHADYKRPEDKKNFLEIYFHKYLIKDNKKYADILLDAIRETKEVNFITYNELAYEVMINKRTDLIERLNNEIDSKKYYGFPLGVIVYMIAIQYERLQDVEHALTDFQTAITCFHPKSIYVPEANKHLQSLKEYKTEQEMQALQSDLS